MKALFKLNDSVTLEVEAESIKDIVDKLTHIKEAIGPEPCGKCKSTDTFPQSRMVEDNTFYEIRCQKCGAILPLGLSKADQNLYKKRMKTDKKGKAVKDNNGKAIYLPNNGWLKWNPETKEME